MRREEAPKKQLPGSLFRPKAVVILILLIFNAHDMRNIRTIFLVAISLLASLIISCQNRTDPFRKGLWRGVFILPGNEIPFVFEVKGKGVDSTTVFLINGEDRFKINKVTFSNDSVSIAIDLYDVVLKGKLAKNTLAGNFIKTAVNGRITKVPFRAEYGNHSRFQANSEPPSVSLDGTWDMKIVSSGITLKTVGNFTQKVASLTGTILEETGDYRFFEGVIHGKKFSLSAFGGSTPYLVKGEFLNDSTFTGEFVTLRQTSKIEGKRNPKASLPDPYSASHLREGFSTVAFTFPNLEGKQVSLSDPKYQGKVVIVTILGSWCPNCLDENTFLSSWYKTNHQRGIEIIGLGFERKDDFESARRSLTALKNRLGIDYEILFAGKSSPESASQALPALNGIAAFPTTLFIDKNGIVRKVHTGFSGPATGKFYEEFKMEFNDLIDNLVAEK